MTADEPRALLTLKISTDKRIAALLKKIAAGKGSFGDTMNYALISGELTGEQLAEVVLELTDDREELVRLLVHDRWEDINEQCAAVQTAFDEHNALHLATQKAAFPAERVMQIAHSLSDPTVSDDTIRRRARSVSNVVVSMHDDFIEANAKFRSGAGLQCFVTRVTDGSCCPWCTRLAGRYRYPEDIPDEIFRRHDNCGCTVTYENGRKRQDVWSKRTWEVPDEEAGSQRPTVFNREQGQKLQADNAPKRLTARPSLFTDMFEEYNNGQKDVIKLRNIEKELEKSLIGKETKQYLYENPCKINIMYNVHVPTNLLGEQDPFNDTISIYASNTKTIAKTAETLIHELTHRRYDIGGDFWSECVCKAQEYKHRYRRNDLTIAEKRVIIKEIKQEYSKQYPNWKWRNRR